MDAGIIPVHQPNGVVVAGVGNCLFPWVLVCAWNGAVGMSVSALDGQGMPIVRVYPDVHGMDPGRDVHESGVGMFSGLLFHAIWDSGRK